MNLGRETETLEFKKSTGELKEGIISIGAILNKHQKGELYFGVRPDGTPIGQEISEKTLRDISQAISNHIEPQIFPEIQTVRIDEIRHTLRMMLPASALRTRTRCCRSRSLWLT